MHTFHEVTCDMLTEYGYDNVKSVFPYEKFRLAWHAFLNLLDVDMTIGFTCPECAATPEIVICDGTSLSFQKRMWSFRQLNDVDENVIDIQTS